MSRGPVSIVLLAWNAWDQTRACLESLRPTLQAEDEVLLVDNGSTDETRKGLEAYPWVRVLSNAENRGLAGGGNQGAAATTRDVIVFLNNGTVLAGDWLEPLVSPLSDLDIAAVGPRSNFILGPQFLAAPYRPGDRAALEQFAGAWAGAHRGQVSTVDHLDGFCLAVRRDAFDAVGGFDEAFRIGGFEDSDLSARLRDAGFTLLVAHASYVHQTGRRAVPLGAAAWRTQVLANRRRLLAKRRRASGAAPLVTACVFGSDASRLKVTLDGLADLCDEILLCDPVGVGDVEELAASSGAIYVRVADDTTDRATQRNAALELASGVWTLWLGENESFEWTDVELVRAQIAAADGPVEGIRTWVHLSDEDGSTRERFLEVRLLRRGRARWEGNSLEMPVRSTHDGPLFTLAADAAHVTWSRNTSRFGVTPPFDPDLTVQLARGFLLSGRPADALRVIDASDGSGATSGQSRQVLRCAIEAAAGLGDVERARSLLAALRSVSRSSLLTGRLEALLCSATGDHAGALALLDTLHPGTDDDGYSHGAGDLALQRANVLAALGRPDLGLPALCARVAEGSAAPALVATCVELIARAGESLDLLLEVVPEQERRGLIETAAFVTDPLATQLLRAAEARWPSLRLAVLSVAAKIAPRLPAPQALQWSETLRAADMAEQCPLVAIAGDVDRDVREAALAAVAGYAAFGDERLAGQFPVRFALADASARKEILSDALSLCPSLVVGRTAGANASAPVANPVPPRVSIIVPCWNKVEYTRRCLASVKEHTAAGTYEVVIVDNGSTDATRELTSSVDEDLVVVRNSTNLGFSRACNQGAAAASGDVLVFLNNDTEALPGWLSPLLDELTKNPGVGIAGSRLLFPDGTLQHAGVVLGYSADGGFDGVHRFYQAPGALPAALERVRLRVVTGAVLGIHAALFAVLGGFDESYWNGLEDVDLCLRAGALGWQVVYQPMSCLVHHESVSGPERFSRIDENRVRFTTRWAGQVLPDGFDSVAGVTVIGCFDEPAGASALARRLVHVLESRAMPVVTTELRPTVPGKEDKGRFVHRLGPSQGRAVLVLPSQPTPVDPRALQEWQVPVRIATSPRRVGAMGHWERALLATSTRMFAGDDVDDAATAIADHLEATASCEPALTLRGGDDRFVRANDRGAHGGEVADSGVGPLLVDHAL